MDRPKDLPNRLECAYCSRSDSHGGECPGKSINRNEEGCLFFKCDDRGCIRTNDIKLPFNLYENIPPLGVWEHNRWILYGKDTSIKIERIKGIEWDKQQGVLYLRATCKYFINEFCEGYEKEKNKPKLKIIK